MSSYGRLVRASKSGNADAQQEIEAIHTAIKALNQELSLILVTRFLKGKTAINTYVTLGYEERMYFRKQNIALLHFAEAYKGGYLVGL